MKGMLLAKKLNLSRFKRSMQGMVEFATLIEQADPQNREKIIKQAESQDEEFLRKAMKRVVFFEELIYLDESILAEILSRTTPKVLAYSLWGQTEEFRTKILKQIGQREVRLFKDEEEKMGDAMTAALSLGGQRQILKVARQLESQQKFQFELSNCPRFKLKRTVVKDDANSAEVPQAAAAGKK